MLACIDVDAAPAAGVAAAGALISGCM
jgi:hypothetical protein